ncbi:DUF2316 family protein [Macrococcus lamae]|uniref:DUF2316 family protein n=1 Tax=Macrococcus lamae TaxID=198484 RepID=A0A4R6BW95_9STAP|nr:DUF2316 family protein [Macrococcus lamae]TDM12714.1 DUF2316 family protein [Macrococcus lamae]
MSLNKKQLQVTSIEMKENFLKSGLSKEQLAERMNIQVPELEHVLNMESYGDLMMFIHLVWDTRDVINAEIIAQGEIPADYSYLKGQKEDYWFLK